METGVPPFLQAPTSTQSFRPLYNTSIYYYKSINYEFLFANSILKWFCSIIANLDMDLGPPLIIKDNQGRVATGSATRLVSFLYSGMASLHEHKKGNATHLTHP